jgi:hypothetical protein
MKLNLLKNNKYIFLYIVLLFFVLNPYTVYGKIGPYFGIILLLMSRSFGIYKILNKNLMSLMLLVLFSIYGFFLSIINDISQTNHLHVTLSLILTIFASVGVWSYSLRHQINFNDLALILLTVILTNSMLILIEFIFPEFRLLVEQYLVQTSSNYTSSMRFRGIASAGGAGLSALSAIGVSISIFLYYKSRINILTFFSVSLFLIITTILIGRTGFILGVVLFSLTPLFFKGKPYYVLIFLSVIYLLYSEVYPWTMDIFANEYGGGFRFYSVEFLFDKDGIDREGTVGAVQNHFDILPNDMSAVTGYGYYGVGETEFGRSDSGFVRMFTSIGYILGIIYYLLFFKVMSIFSNRQNTFLLVMGFSILIIAEVKEVLLLSQFGFRVMAILAIFSVLSVMYKKIPRTVKLQ